MTYKVGFKSKGEWQYIKVEKEVLLETIADLLIYSEKVSISKPRKEVIK